MIITIKSNHLLVYYDKELAARDNNGWCVEISESAYRFPTMAELMAWLNEQADFLGAYLHTPTV